MRTATLSLVLTLTVIFSAFFVVFSFHAQSPIQHEVQTYLETGHGDLAFSQDANSHMHDVFVLFSAARVLTAVLWIILLTQLAYITAKVLRTAGYLSVVVPMVLAITPWNTTFTTFHQIFFPQGNWMFPANSLLIQTYPAEFFVQFAAVLAIIIISVGILLVVLSRKQPAFVSRQEV